MATTDKQSPLTKALAGADVGICSCGAKVIGLPHEEGWTSWVLFDDHDDPVCEDDDGRVVGHSPT